MQWNYSYIYFFFGVFVWVLAMRAPSCFKFYSTLEIKQKIVEIEFKQPNKCQRKIIFFTLCSSFSSYNSFQFRCYHRHQNHLIIKHDTCLWAEATKTASIDCNEAKILNFCSRRTFFISKRKKKKIYNS